MRPPWQRIDVKMTLIKLNAILAMPPLTKWRPTSFGTRACTPNHTIFSVADPSVSSSSDMTKNCVCVVAAVVVQRKPPLAPGCGVFDRRFRNPLVAAAYLGLPRVPRRGRLLVCLSSPRPSSFSDAPWWRRWAVSSSPGTAHDPKGN